MEQARGGAQDSKPRGKRARSEERLVNGDGDGAGVGLLTRAEEVTGAISSIPGPEQ